MQYSLLFLVLSTPGFAEHIKGVAPQDQHLYSPDSDGYFACLGDSSIRIPFQRVNDDYCDCPDGSDEPGTAACSNGKFWCAGSNQYVPSRIVGDGACDYDLCCDGSDETPGLCPDRCAEVKARQAEKHEAAMKFLRDGAAIRNDLATRAQTRKQELVTLVEDLNKEISQTNSQLSKALADLEVAEKEDEESSSDPESVNAIGELRDVLRSAESDVNQLSERFVELSDSYNVLEKALAKMSIDYNPNFNDPAVKDAIKVWKAHSIPDRRLPSVQRNYIGDIDLLDTIKVASSSEAVSQSRNPNSVWNYLDKLLPPIITESFMSSKHSGASAGVRVQKVEATIEELSRKLKELEQSLDLNEKLLKVGEAFWGPEEIGHGVEEVCVNAQRGDFNYEVCYFGSATQLDGRFRVDLGLSRGLKESEDGQLTIDYEGGNQCPNGVRRSLTLYLECGHSHEAIFVEEPEMCHYTMTAKSPLACKLPQEDSEIRHEEL